MSEEPRKRSRFDKAPDDERKPRLERRSRSPPEHDHSSSNRRSRSPLKSLESPATNNAAAKAAEAAAKINAQLQSKRGIQHVDVPAIRADASIASGAAAGVKSPSATPSGALNTDIYQQDGDFIRDIEVNDLRNRYTLTKGSTQKMIKEETGADVTTRGSYYPDKSLATATAPPLYLHITSTTKEGLEKAVAKIEELMQQELPNLIDERRFRRRDAQEDRPQPERDHLGRRKWPERRIPIDLEPIPGFNLRAQVVGSGGSYVKHIQQETRCRVQIKGRGSGFMEHETSRESDEQMYLHVAGPEQEQVDAAADMCNSLLDSVRDNYNAFKERGPTSRGPPGGSHGHSNGGYGDDRGGYRGGRGQDEQPNSGSYGGGAAYGTGNMSSYAYGQDYAAATQGYSGAQFPTSARPQQQSTDPMEQQKQYEAWAAYYAANPSADPYAAYGGYGAMMAQFMTGTSAAHAGHQTPNNAQSQTPSNYNNGAAPPPPPPPDDQGIPPPPPPPGASTGSQGYGSVPPPPGL